LCPGSGPEAVLESLTVRELITGKHRFAMARHQAFARMFGAISIAVRMRASRAGRRGMR
jgi:hypothetical protein